MSDVLFVQDTQDNYDDLQEKDPNTIYAVNDSGDFSESSKDTEGKLFVGKVQVSGFPPNFRNLVSPYSLMPVANASIGANKLVFKGTDGKLYSIDGNGNIQMDPMWGLGFLTAAVSANNRPLAQNVLQQGYYDEEHFDEFTNNAPLVLVCERNGNGFCTSGNIKEFGSLTDSDEAFIYLGLAVNTGTTVGIALDLSSHNFFTRNNGLIYAINGIDLTSPTRTLEKTSTHSGGTTTGEFVGMTNLSSKRRVFYTSINTPGVYRIYANLSIKSNYPLVDGQIQTAHVGLFGGYDTTPAYQEQSPLFAVKVSFLTQNQVIPVALEQQIEVTAAMLANDKHLFIGYGLQTSVGTVDILDYEEEFPVSHLGVQLIARASEYSAFIVNDFEDSTFII